MSTFFSPANHPSTSVHPNAVPSETESVESKPIKAKSVDLESVMEKKLTEKWLKNLLAELFPTQSYSGHYLSQLLNKRNIASSPISHTDSESAQSVIPFDRSCLAAFLHPDYYRPTDPFAFGDEMAWAIARLQQARDHHERIAIWGDFDADGLTATAVLWDGLRQFFPASALSYTIPNRFTESHGLNIPGLNRLADEGCNLLVTCDTGSTSLEEIAHAHTLGIDIIITDHHTLAEERPNVVALINPCTLPADHPFAHLAGVAVAYKLIEALYETLPHVPKQPLTRILDLVAIGLITDLVSLEGDCRYLAQRGIQQLQTLLTQQPPSRPGIAQLLKLCRRTGDRPTDISFGIGPRINAISRIHGDATFAIELLTSQDRDRCRQLAEQTELANSRRKALQRDVMNQVTTRIAELDLSTTQVIVLADPQWSIGVLGLVAGQIAQEYNRPTILLSTPTPQLKAEGRRQKAENPPLAPPKRGTEPPQLPNSPTPIRLSAQVEAQLPNSPLARGSARSAHNINLYDLVKSQSHLLDQFGGHPFAAGLSIAVENIPVFRDSINQACRTQYGDLAKTSSSMNEADLTVTVAELGQNLFRELKLIEPCGMGNPVPRLLIQHCEFKGRSHRNIKDFKGDKLRYIKADFRVCDRTCPNGFPGTWWGHYQDELPDGPCDAIVELDFNSYKSCYEIRLLDRPHPTVHSTETSSECSGESHSHQSSTPSSPSTLTILDYRPTQRPNTPTPQHQTSKIQNSANSPTPQLPNSPTPQLSLTQCPHNWAEWEAWIQKSVETGHPLAIAFSLPTPSPPAEIWKHLVGIAKYLSRTQTSIDKFKLANILGIGDRPLSLGFIALTTVGFHIQTQNTTLLITSSQHPNVSKHNAQTASIQTFLYAVQEEQFQQRYFTQVAVDTLEETLK
ncbi:MAG: DHH family phosphoesterase [Cyanobacteria bacterium P01_F01_bin.150]